MEFLPLSRRRSSAQNVPSGEERGETDVSQANPVEVVLLGKLNATQRHKR